MMNFFCLAKKLQPAIIICLMLLLGACSGDDPESPENLAEQIEQEESGFARVDSERMLNAAFEPEQWMSYGQTYDEQRFSALEQINAENVSELGLAWYADFDTNRGQESTPLVIDGVIYVSTAWSKVYAFDARTGEQLWFFDPQVPGEKAAHVCCDVVNRGLAAWQGKIYLGTLDGRLIALDAASGEEVWSIQTTDPEAPYSITGAPRIAKGLVLIGQAGAEYGVRGYLSAYDAVNGDLIWRFYTVPGNPADGFESEELAMAAETWNGEWWALGGGGTVWDSIVYDQELDQVYIGVGNGSPWNASIRSPGGGDNLFLSSVVAVRANTGEYLWHYQTTPRETWDYTATQPIMIANLMLDGEERRVVMQAPKNGFFYVLDAEDGELISADAFAEITWATGVSMETGRPVEVQGARYDETGEGLIVAPSALGAHSWHPWSYNPDTGMVYTPAMNTSTGYVPVEEMEVSPIGSNLGVDLVAGRELIGQPGQIEPLNEGYLQAWDPVAREEVWRVSLGVGRGGGTLSTAGGLVFQGNTLNQEFAAYAATNGEKLWAMPVQTGVVAGAVSYALDGEQYIAVAAGNAQNGGYYAPNHSRLLVFKLGGEAALPPVQEFTQRPLAPPQALASAEQVADGAVLYAETCNLCHGVSRMNRGTFPDLSRTPLLYTQDGFDAVVLDGALAQNGMASFAELLDPEDTQAIRAYLIAQANALLDAENTQIPTIGIPGDNNN